MLYDGHLRSYDTNDFGPFLKILGAAWVEGTSLPWQQSLERRWKEGAG